MCYGLRNKEVTWKPKTFFGICTAWATSLKRIGLHIGCWGGGGVCSLVAAGRGGDAGWARREWNKPGGRGGEIERMIHLAGGCREISGVEGLGGSWETEREMVPVGKKEMSWGLTARRAGGQSACVRERRSREEFERELCRLWQTMAWVVLDKQGNGNQEVINKWSDRTIFVGEPRDHGGFLWGWTNEVDLMNHLRVQTWEFSPNKKCWGPLQCHSVDGEKVSSFSSFHVKKVLVPSLWFEPSTVSIQPVHWFHIIWPYGAFQFMCKLRGKRSTVLTWRSGNHIKDSCRPCLRVVWNHEPNRDVSEDMSYLLELCVQGGNELPWVHFIQPTFQTRPMLFAVVFYCSWLSFFAVWVFHQGLFYWLNMHLYFPPPILVNFV